MNKSYISWFYFLIFSTSVLAFTSKGIDQTPQNEIESNYDKFKELRISQPEDALNYAIKAYEIAIQSNDLVWVAKTSRATGWVLNSLGSYDTGYYYLLKSIEYGKLLKDEQHLKYVYNDAGLNRRNLNKYDQALSHFFSSLAIRQKTNDKEEMSIIYNNIGLVYYALVDYKKAVEYHLLSLELNKELDDQGSSVINMVNLGLCYMGNKEFDIALDYFHKVLKICEIDCFEEVHIQALGGLGHIYYDLGKHKIAKQYFVQSNELSKVNDTQKYLASNYNYLANILFEAHKVDSALILLNTAQDFALAAEDVEWIRNNLKLYSTIYANAEDFEQAFIYHEQYVSFRDSTYNDEVFRNLSEIHVNIQKSKDDRIIKILDDEISIMTQQTIMFGLSTLMVTVLLFLVYKNNKVRKRINAKLGNANLTIENQNAKLNEMNQQLDIKVKERTERFLQANHQLKDSRAELDNFIYRTSHDIQGPLATLKGVCNVASLELKDANSLSFIKRISDTATNLNDILSQLQVVNNINNIDLDPKTLDFTRIITTAQQEAKGRHLNGKTINFKTDLKLSSEVVLDKFLIEIIIYNLISNGFKFHDEDKTIDSFVNCRVDHSKDKLTITVTDNGIGIDKELIDLLFKMFTRFSDRNREGGIGLYLVKCAVDRMDGKIKVAQTGEGHTKFEVEIPMIN